MDRPEAPFMAWLGLAMGLAGLVFTVSVSWGLIGSRARRVEQTRARLAYRTTLKDPRRALAVMPWMTALFLGYAASVLIPGASGDTLLKIVALVGLVIGGIAILRPDPFLPGWFREADRRRAAGLPLGIEPPPEGTAPRVMTPRERRLAWGLIAGALIVGVVFGFSLAYFGAVLLGAGQGFASLASNRRPSLAGDHE